MDRATRPCDRASAAAASPPSTTASTVAIAANRSELATASSGDTNSREPALTPPSARHPASP